MPFPYIFTFYSYKGGVGRSMALMNVAYTLASWGRHVLVVDMDLEAPGVSGFLQRSDELVSPEAAHPKDILTFLGEAAVALAGSGTTRERALRLPPLDHYMRSVDDAKLQPLQPKLGKLGRLDVLGTDRALDYSGRLAQLELRGLPDDQILSLSSLLHHYFKAQRFLHRPLGVEEDEPQIETAYDYVLVDSRTGFTEIGGLCVGPLADRLVVITGLNDQNIHGTLSFLQEAGIQPVRRSKDAKPWDDADPIASRDADSPSLGPKPTIVVASPVPAGEIDYKRQRLGDLQQRLGIRPISLSYHPRMALMESVFVRDYREEYLAGEYTRLTTAVMAQVADDSQSLASEVNHLLDEESDVAQAIAFAVRVAAHSPETGISLLQVLEQAVRDIDIPEKAQLYSVLYKNPGTRLLALNNWGNTLYRQAKLRVGADADRLFDSGGRKYAELWRLNPRDYRTLNNWAIALVEQGKMKVAGEAEPYFGEAALKFSDASRLKPDDPAILNSWANALIEQAQTNPRRQSDLLLNARQPLIKAEHIRAGSGAYNLACIESIQGNTADAIRWLFLAASTGQIPRKDLIASDKDFDAIRNHPDFVRFMESLPENS